MTKYTFDNARRWTPQRFASLVVRHDVVVDELDAKGPDLVHTRLVVLQCPGTRSSARADSAPAWTQALVAHVPVLNLSSKDIRR